MVKKRITGSTALMYAAEQGHFDLVVELIKKEASIVAKDSRGYKARDYAKFRGHGQIAFLLDSVEAGGNVPAIDNAADLTADYSIVDKEPTLLFGANGYVVDSLIELQHQEDLGFGSRTTLKDPAGARYNVNPVDLEQQSTITLMVLVDQHGAPKRVYVSSCSFDLLPVSVFHSAFDFARQLEFQPAMRDGKPIERWISLTQKVARRLLRG